MGLFSGPDPISIEVLGKPLRCEICKGDRFWRREAQLNTAVASFFNFDWANASAVCIVCHDCGYIHWFLPTR